MNHNFIDNEIKERKKKQKKTSNRNEIGINTKRKKKSLNNYLIIKMS